MKLLNEYLANLALWNVKLHNLHWNVVGPAFKQVHEYLESLYDNAFEQYDAVAETLKMQGHNPLARMSDYLAAASLKELESKDFAISEALQIVRSDMKQMRDLAGKIREQADKEDNFMVANLMEDYMSAYDKNLWFIDSMLK